MPVVVKSTHSDNKHSDAIISKAVKCYANEPYFLAKAEEAKKTIDRIGLPRQKKK